MGQPAEAPGMVVLALVGLAVALTGAVLVARPLLVWPTNTEAAQTGEQSSAEQRTQTQAVGLICVGVGLWVLREGLPAPG